MKKIIGMLIVLAMLMSIATVAGAFGFGEVNELQIGENVAEYAPVYYEEYGEYVISPVMYMWTVPEDGTLTIDFSDEDEATVMCFIIYNNAEAYDIYEKGGSVTFDVVAGATLTMEVYNEEAHIYEAATFHFTVSLGEAAPGMAGTGDEYDPWIIETMPAVLTGTISEADGANEDWMGYFYQFTAPESGIVSWGPWTGCGLFVTMNGEWIDADSVEVVAGDVVLFNVWALCGAGEYTANVAFEAAAMSTVEHTFDSLVDVNIGSTDDKAEIPAGTTFADGFFTVVGKMTQRYQESKGGIYAVEIAKNGTGALEFTTTGVADVTFVVSSTGGSNVSAVALINVNTLEVMVNEEGLSEVETTAATTLTYVGLPAGTYQLVSPESDYNRGFRLMTATVVETVAEEAPVCTHEWMYLEYDFCYEEEGLYDLYEYCPDCGYIGRRYTPGTEKNPLMLDDKLQWNDDWSEATATITVGAGETVIYGINRVSGMILFINGEEYGALEPSDPWDFWAPCTFELANDTDAEMTFEIKLSWPLGSDYNPDELPINETFELYLAENSYEYVYRWFATADGTLTITVEGENWLFYVNNWGDPDDWSDDYYGDRAFDCYGDPNTITIEVKTGDEVLLYVGTQDADWNAPETTLTITVSFGGEQGPCTHKNLVHVDAVAPGCYNEGNIEHWYCEDCETVWADEALTMITNHQSVKLPATHQHIVHVDAKAPSCYEEGNVEYWYCEDCVTVWVDEALLQISNMMSVKLPATHQHIVHVDAVAPDCYNEGNVEYWYCEDCVTVWVDEALLQISNMMSVKLPATHQHIVHVEAVAPSCTEHGNVEYWYCEDCVTVWIDEALLQISNMKNVVDPAIGHNYVDGVCANCGENDQSVPDTGDMIAVACALVVVSGMAVIALPKKKEN